MMTGPKMRGDFAGFVRPAPFRAYDPFAQTANTVVSRSDSLIGSWT